MNSTINKQTRKESKKGDVEGKFDQTKQTFIDKLRGYQELTDVNKVKEREDEIKRNAQRIKQKLTYELRSPRANSVSSNVKSFLGTNNRSIFPTTSKFLTPMQISTQQQKLTTPISVCNNNSRQQPSLSLMSTKFTTQQKYLQEQLQRIVKQMSITQTRYNSHKERHYQQSRLNFMELDEFEKYLIVCQKEYQMEYNMVVDRSKEDIVEYIQQAMVDTQTKHKSHFQSTLGTLNFIDQECQLLSKGITNESQLCESDWCLELDKINQRILSLNNFITQTRQEETDRYADAQWRIKEIQFACEDAIEKESKLRLAQEHKIYAVIQQLIQKVGAPVQ